MVKKATPLQIAQNQAEIALKGVNDQIVELGTYTGTLFSSLNKLQEVFDRIRNVPSEKRLQYEEAKEIRLRWKQQAEKIDRDYKTATVKAAGSGAAGVGVGVAVAALGPTAAMGVATTFGVASTGTAISSLSGAAATNAALAWLGGGAVAVGGGGMAAGNVLLAMAGPIGWSIAGVSIMISALTLVKSILDKKHIEKIFMLISERDMRSYDLATIELKERIARIVEEEAKINNAVSRIETFGTDYSSMTEAQQYELGAYVNLMVSSTQLLINPIIGLQPKYSEEDYDKFCKECLQYTDDRLTTDEYKKRKRVITSFANLLYAIDLTERDKKLLYKVHRKNKQLLKSLDITAKEFDRDIFDVVTIVLNYLSA